MWDGCWRSRARTCTPPARHSCAQHRDDRREDRRARGDERALVVTWLNRARCTCPLRGLLVAPRADVPVTKAAVPDVCDKKPDARRRPRRIGHTGSGAALLVVADGDEDAASEVCLGMAARGCGPVAGARRQAVRAGELTHPDPSPTAGRRPVDRHREPAREIGFLRTRMRRSRRAHGQPIERIAKDTTGTTSSGHRGVRYAWGRDPLAEETRSRRQAPRLSDRRVQAPTIGAAAVTSSRRGPTAPRPYQEENPDLLPRLRIDEARSSSRHRQTRGRQRLDYRKLHTSGATTGLRARGRRKPATPRSPGLHPPDSRRGRHGAWLGPPSSRPPLRRRLSRRCGTPRGGRSRRRRLCTFSWRPIAGTARRHPLVYPEGNYIGLGRAPSPDRREQVRQVHARARVEARWTATAIRSPSAHGERGQGQLSVGPLRLGCTATTRRLNEFRFPPTLPVDPPGGVEKILLDAVSELPSITPRTSCLVRGVDLGIDCNHPPGRRRAPSAGRSLLPGVQPFCPEDWVMRMATMIC